eukprot:TCONS_00020734-protein
MAAELLWIFNIFITTISITIAHKGTVNFLVHSFKNDSKTNQVYDTAIMNMEQSNSNIEFQFRRADDSFFSWTVFFEKDIQIFNSINLGESELNEQSHRFICFLAYYDGNQISQLKLIERLSESVPFEYVFKEIKALETKIWIMDQVIHPHEIDKSIAQKCQGSDLILSNKEQIRQIADFSNLFNGKDQTFRFQSLPINQYPFCLSSSASDLQIRCKCQAILNIGWYPCGERSCDNGEDKLTCNMFYCQRTHKFIYLVDKWQDCLNTTL